jgi:2-polyprenyl-3-methyl-5-hydroxy-6-metoxy-1,4-benzoquinol methylase
MKWRPEDRPCPLCGGSRVQRIGERGGKAHRSGLGTLTTVVRCRECTLLYTKPTLFPEENPYEQHAAGAYFEKHTTASKLQTGRELAQYAAGRLGRPGRMLEIGCGRGDLLLGAREEGWAVVGIEMTPAFADVAAANGIVVHREPVESSTVFTDGGVYDAVLIAGVLEHLYDPLQALRRARSIMRPGGLVFIDVPNEWSVPLRLGNLYMRCRGRRWATNLSPTFPPYHVVGFTPQSLRRALETTGFRVVELSTPRWTNALFKSRSAWESLELRGLAAASWLGSKMGSGDGICGWSEAI